MSRPLDQFPDAAGLNLALVVSRYNRAVTDALEHGAQVAFEACGGSAAGLRVIDAPGSFELPVIARAAAASARFDAVVCLGCVIRGETRHDEVIADAIAHGVIGASIATGVPIAFGVLTVSNVEQARARSQPVRDAGSLQIDESTGKRRVDNKGVEATLAALSAARSIRELESRR